MWRIEGSGAHRGATETQARRCQVFLIAVVIDAVFGILADDVQKMQFAFLNNCRDDTQTRHASQRFFERLQQAGESELVAKRTDLRPRIVKSSLKKRKTKGK